MTDGDLKQDGHSLKDTVAKRYFGQREVFADLCNAFLFRQPGRLDASKLRPMPTAYNELILNADGKYESHKRERDLAFQAFTDGDRGYALLCAEFQSTSDKTMPVRIMLYDGLGYAYQLKNRLCSETGRVLPISTMVVNIGSQEWKGPKSLHGMFPATDDFVEANVPDYPIKVFDPRTEDVKILDSLCTDLKSVSYLFRYSDRGDLLSEKYQDDSTSYLGGYGIDLVNVCLNMGLEVPEEGRRLEMCKAVEDLKAMGRTEGIEKVAANALKNGMPHNVVEKITGLPPLRIQQIAQEIRHGGIC